MSRAAIEGDGMRAEYDFSEAGANPYARRLKRQVTIRLDAAVIDYFKEQSDRTGVPYQSIINLYLNDCVQQGRKLTFVCRGARRAGRAGA
ncbi:MAG: BrnA antitoxin family protein, partial [Coriobacteriales bacterium]|nr:BrnA antitoxin family protein [Coriobacteriales bacterium]